MAITSSAVIPSNSLEEFRIQFNKLVTDVDGISAASAFGASISFEGATSDDFETTLIVVDPTADRTITLPNATGTVLTTGNSDVGTTTTSSSDADFILVDDAGVLKKITAANLGVGTPTDITVADESSDTTCFPLFVTAATGDLGPKSGTNLTFNSSTGILTATSLSATTAVVPDASGGADLGTTSLEWGDVYVADDKYVQFGSGQDILMGYDETTTDSLKIAATEGAALAITLMADEGDDAGDEWKLNVADGGTITLGNDIASAGTYVTHLTITPNSTVASSTMAFAGSITAAGNALSTAADVVTLAIALG